MRDIFSVVGTVLSFRIVYDRETGNPKGYGFAEYMDIDTAQSAIRNLSGFEFGGRTLRVDRASSQADELKVAQQQQSQGNFSQGPARVENFYGPPVDPRRAPEVISQAVASLPPEQMFELMKQLKQCVQNNPSQARQMLLHNPQLAYALLQAQVVMRIVEPQVALALLYRQDSSQVAPLQAPSAGPPVNVPAAAPFVQRPVMPNMIPPALPQQNPQPTNPTPLMYPPPLQQQHQHPFPGNANQPSNAIPNIETSPLSTHGFRPDVNPERNNLLMQVVQLSDEQIASLPLDQRQSIMMLKEQLANTSSSSAGVNGLAVNNPSATMHANFQM